MLAFAPPRPSATTKTTNRAQPQVQTHALEVDLNSAHDGATFRHVLRQRYSTSGAFVELHHQVKPVDVNRQALLPVLPQPKVPFREQWLREKYELECL